MMMNLYADYKAALKADGITYHIGKVIATPVIDLKLNTIVKTKYDIGRVKNIIYGYDSTGYIDRDIIHKVEVEMLTTTTKSKKFKKSFKYHDLTSIVIYHKPLKMFIILSPKDYVYIIEENQEVQYRITNRRFATLSPLYKAETEYIKLFNEKRGGANILKDLLKKGFVIQRQ
jgi:hypothetical protein